MAVNAGKTELHSDKEVKIILDKMCKDIDVIRGGPLIHADQLLRSSKPTLSEIRRYAFHGARNQLYWKYTPGRAKRPP